MSVLTLGILVMTLLLEGVGATLRLLPGFVFCIAWQQSDLFWHLGLNRQARTGELLQSVGLANVLTEIRGVCAAYLLGRLVGGLNTGQGLALAVFLTGIVTDILDGFVARSTHTQSTLGQIADAEADFSLYLVFTIILAQDDILPLWLVVIIAARFVIPVLVGLGSYVFFARVVKFGSTIWGKGAALVQCVYFLVLLAPPRFLWVTHIANFPLLLATLVLTIAAPIAQIWKNIRVSS